MRKLKSLGCPKPVVGLVVPMGYSFAAVRGSVLSAMGHIPVVGLALLLGVDCFMSEARTITNLIGNGVATLALSYWEGELDPERARAVLGGRTQPRPNAAPPELPWSKRQVSWATALPAILRR